MVPFFKSPWQIFTLLIFLGGCFGFLRHSQQMGVSLPRLRSNLPGSVESPSVSRSHFSPNLRALIAAEENENSAMAYARFLQVADLCPPGYRETVSDLAPENGWFDLWEIRHRSDGIYSEIAPPEPPDDDEELPFPVFKIIDVPQMNDLIDLFHQAATKPKLTNYFLEMHAALAAEQVPATNWIEEFSRIPGILSFTPPAETVTHLSDFLPAATQHLIKSNDRAAFLSFEASAATLAHELHADSHTLIDALVLQAYLKAAYEHFPIAADHFQLPEIARKYSSLGKRLEDHLFAFSSHGNEDITDENRRLIDRHGSMLVNLTGVVDRLSTNPKPLTEADLLPACRVENAVMTRIRVIAIFLFFTVLGVVTWLLGLRLQPGQKSHLKSILGSSENCARWKMIILGVTLPFAFFLALRYLTPLGQLNYAASYSGYDHLFLPLLGLFSLILGSSFVTALWVADPDRETITFDLLLIGLPILSIFTMSQYPSFSKADWLPQLSGLLCVTCLVLLGVMSFRMRLSQADRRPLVRILLTPAFFLVAGYFGIWSFGLMIEEETWFARDDYANAQGHFISTNEARVTTRLLSQIGELLP